MYGVLVSYRPAVDNHIQVVLILIHLPPSKPLCFGRLFPQGSCGCKSEYPWYKDLEGYWKKAWVPKIAIAKKGSFSRSLLSSVLLFAFSRLV